MIKMADFDFKKLTFGPVKNKTAKGNSSIKYKSISFGYDGSEEAPIVKIQSPIFCFGVQKKASKDPNKDGKDTSKGFSVCFSIPKTQEGLKFKNFIVALYEAAGNHLGTIGDKIDRPKLKPTKDSWENIFPSPLYAPKDPSGNEKIYTNLICFETGNKQPIKTDKTPAPNDTSGYNCQTLLKMITKFGSDGKIIESKVIDPLGNDAKGNYKMMPAIQLRGLFIGKDVRMQLDLFNGIIFPQNSANTQDLMNDELNSYIATISKDKLASIGAVTKEEVVAAGSDDAEEDDGAL
jgi:hypothetical protein